MAKLLNVKLDKIYLYPLGGISKFHLPLNYSIKKEFLILVAGPIAQALISYILIKLLPNYQNLVIAYNKGILLFNMLPIYPLDGGKLVHLFFQMVLPYKKSLELTILLSYITILFYFLLAINNLKVNNIAIVAFLLYKVFKEMGQIQYIYEKFILERYLHDYNFKKSKLITSTNHFYKSNRHLIKENDEYYLEKEFLTKKYEKSVKKSIKNVDN